MSDRNLALPKGCAWQTGIIFIRRCENPSEFECAECGLPLCGGHARREDMPFDAALAGQGDAADPSAPFQSLGEDTVLAGAGEDKDAVGEGMRVYCPTCLDKLFGAGFVSSGDTNYRGGFYTGSGYDDMNNQPFAEEDYAAFDEISDFDKNAGVGHGYDS
ncbi:MAG: hypothetical protein WCI11_18160 [Candidatus Methylumidiphilus sp.]